MSLRKCPECGGAVARIAIACPHCGYMAAYGETCGQVGGFCAKGCAYACLLMVVLILLIFVLGTC